MKFDCIYIRFSIVYPEIFFPPLGWIIEVILYLLFCNNLRNVERSKLISKNLNVYSFKNTNKAHTLYLIIFHYRFHKHLVVVIWKILLTFLSWLTWANNIGQPVYEILFLRSGEGSLIYYISVEKFPEILF